MTPGSNLLDRRAADVMTVQPVTIARQHAGRRGDSPAWKSARSRPLVVVDDHGIVEGVVHLHDLWRTQMI